MAGTLITGQGIALYRLLSMRQVVIMEAKGIKMFRRSITAQAKRELGLKVGTSRDNVILALDQAIEAQATQLKPGEIREI